MKVGPVRVSCVSEGGGVSNRNAGVTARKVMESLSLMGMPVGTAARSVREGWARAFAFVFVRVCMRPA